MFSERDYSPHPLALPCQGRDVRLETEASTAALLYTQSWVMGKSINPSISSSFNNNKLQSLETSIVLFQPHHNVLLTPSSKDENIKFPNFRACSYFFEFAVLKWWKWDCISNLPTQTPNSLVHWTLESETWSSWPSRSMILTTNANTQGTVK